MTYAVLSPGGIVENIIDADASFIAAAHPGAVSIDGIEPRPGIGWMHWPRTNTFSAPGEPAPTHSDA
jgi:hypothetical protein